MFSQDNSDGCAEYRVDDEHSVLSGIVSTALLTHTIRYPPQDT